MLLVELIRFLGGMLAINVGSGLLSDLVTLSGFKLTSVEIDLSILGDEADHLMIYGWNDLHVM